MRWWMSMVTAWTGTTASYGVIFVDGISVNPEMVKAGLAEVYDGRPPWV
jgi:endonuclease YncB( thermonuclease family)